jgi:signal peptidase II
MIGDAALFKWISAAIAVLLIVIDQMTKILIKSNFTEGSSVSIIPNFLDFTYITNQGAAFGMLQGQRWIFLSVTTIIIVAAIYMLVTNKIRGKLLVFAAMLIVAGGIGNMIDRIFRGYVIDFINVRFVNFYVFNVADSCVCIGASLIIIKLVIDIYHEKKGVSQ